MDSAIFGDDKEDSILRRYYSLRAGEYDLLYEKPDRQKDLKEMAGIVINTLSGSNILEVACGTGYWTELLAPFAKSIFALDINSEMISVARARTEKFKNVHFQLGNAYSFETSYGPFNAAFCGYWMSHVKRKNMRPFLSYLGSKLQTGSAVILLDNIYVDGTTLISRYDIEGNSYQARKLLDGRDFEIVKNFLDESELMNLTDSIGYDRKYYQFQYYWLFHFRTI